MNKKKTSVEKLQYWYSTEVHICVVCFKEIKYRERVYDKEKSGTKIYDTACNRHFI
jgi:hypothetical protein